MRLLTNAEWVQILNRLIRLTDARRLDWTAEIETREAAETSGMIFRVGVNGALYVLDSVDADGAFPYRLEVRGANDFADSIVSPSSGRANTEELITLRSLTGDLYKSAFRSYFRAPERAEQLIADLDALSA